MKQHWGYTNDIFDQGYKALRNSTFLFSAVMIGLGILIFMFPQLIAFMIAAFILFLGVSALVIGYKIWKLKNTARPFEWEEEQVFEPEDVEGHRHSQKRITFIMR